MFSVSGETFAARTNHWLLILTAPAMRPSRHHLDSLRRHVSGLDPAGHGMSVSIGTKEASSVLISQLRTMWILIRASARKWEVRIRCSPVTVVVVLAVVMSTSVRRPCWLASKWEVRIRCSQSRATRRGPAHLPVHGAAKPVDRGQLALI